MGSGNGSRAELAAVAKTRSAASQTVAAPLRPLVAAMSRVLRDHRLSARINRRLMRYPTLHGWLVDLSRRAGIYPGQLPLAHAASTPQAAASALAGAPPAPAASAPATTEAAWRWRGDAVVVHAEQRSPQAAVQPPAQPAGAGAEAREYPPPGVADPVVDATWRPDPDALDRVRRALAWPGDEP